MTSLKASISHVGAYIGKLTFIMSANDYECADGLTDGHTQEAQMMCVEKKSQLVSFHISFWRISSYFQQNEVANPSTAYNTISFRVHP